MKILSPMARVEPATYWFQVEHSTTELWPLADKSDLSGVFIYFICVFFIFFGWPRGGRRGLGVYKWCIRLKMLLKSNKALCLPVHQSPYEKHLKNKNSLEFLFSCCKMRGLKQGYTPLDSFGVSRGTQLLTPYFPT